MGLTAAQSSRKVEEAETVGVVLGYIRNPNAENVQLAPEQHRYEPHRYTCTQISFTKYLLEYYTIYSWEHQLYSYGWIFDCSRSLSLTFVELKGQL